MKGRTLTRGVPEGGIWERTVVGRGQYQEGRGGGALGKVHTFCVNKYIYL